MDDTLHNMILKAAKLIDSGKCLTLGSALERVGVSGYPLQMFYPTTDDMSFVQSFYDVMPDPEARKQWRVLALCLFAAMKEEE
jgi:hypothetical protein